MESCSSENASEQYLVTDWAQLHSIDEIMSSFGLPERTPMANVPCPRDLPSTIEHATEKNLKGMKRKRIPECDAQSNSSMVNHSVEGEKQKDVPTETSKSPMDKDGKKEDYIHIRARRGQATNSHSLAERVRREKISERMKLLQEIVPGCNKITGKAVMLDEIINYVQSLQKQVEFLSMKLAAVNPETNLDMQEIYTKEILNSRYGSSPGLGYCPQAFPMAQVLNLWDNEFQNAFQMGLVPNIPHTGTELNGDTKSP